MLARGKGLWFLVALPKLLLPTTGTLGLGNPPSEPPCPALRVLFHELLTGVFGGPGAALRGAGCWVMLYGKDPPAARRCLSHATNTAQEEWESVGGGGRLPPPPPPLLFKRGRSPRAWLLASARPAALNNPELFPILLGFCFVCPGAGTPLSLGQGVRVGCSPGFPGSGYSPPKEADATSVFPRRLRSCC